MSTLPPPPAPVDPAFASEATVVVEGASVWFGPNVALNMGAAGETAATSDGGSCAAWAGTKKSFK